MKWGQFFIGACCGAAFFLQPQAAGAADIVHEVATCSAITGDLERLECFDHLSDANSLNKPQDTTPVIDEKGDWSVSVEVNPVDDTKTVILALKSVGAASRFGEIPVLFIRCKSNETDLYIDWHDYLGSDAIVLARTGGDKASASAWTLSSDKKASFYPSNPVAFIKKMSETDKFVAQVTPYDESPVTAVFKTSGLSNALKPVQETCKWK